MSLIFCTLAFLPFALAILFFIRIYKLFKRVSGLENSSAGSEEKIRILTRKLSDMEREFARIRKEAAQGTAIDLHAVREKQTVVTEAPASVEPAVSDIPDSPDIPALPKSRVVRPEAFRVKTISAQIEAAEILQSGESEIQRTEQVNAEQVNAEHVNAEQTNAETLNSEPRKSQPESRRPEPRKPETQSAPPRKSLPINYNPPRSEKTGNADGPSFWNKLEQQLSDNWTGIGGTLFLVLGIAFLGLHTALKMSEFGRFVLITSLSGVLAGLFFWLQSKKDWIKLALWMRSAAGGVFLFACLGAGGIPGLKWIDAPTPALALLILGIAVNTWLAHAGGSQAFASLHVILSLAAIAVAPSSITTLTLAGLVAVIGVLLSYRERWDHHLLATITAFFLFHLHWFLTMAAASGEVPYLIRGGLLLDRVSNVCGIISVALVFLAAASVHYRDLYRSATFELNPFIVHMLNWLFLGSGLLMHATGSRWKTIPLFIAAAAAFALARHARSRGIKWLYRTDTMMAQIIASIAVVSLYRWGFPMAGSFALLFMEWVVFGRLMVAERDIPLFRMATAGIHLTAVLLMGWGVFTIADAGLHAQTLSVEGSPIAMALILILCGWFAAMWHKFIALPENSGYLKQDGLFSLEWSADCEFSFSGFLAPLFLLAAAQVSGTNQWLPLILSLFFCHQLWVRGKAGTNGMSVGIAIAICSFFVMQWNYYESMTLMAGLPLFLISIAAFKWSYVPYFKDHAHWFGLYTATIHAMFLSVALLNRVSAPVPGVLWLILSVGMLESALWVSQRSRGVSGSIGTPDRYMLHCGYLLIAAFIGRHLMVDLQCEDYLGPMKVRGLIELFAIAIFGYWGFAVKAPRQISRHFSTKNGDSASATSTSATSASAISASADSGVDIQQLIYRSWRLLHPLFMELILVFHTLFFALQTDKYWHAIIWAITAIVLHWQGSRKTIGQSFPNLSRLRFHALLFYLVSIFQTAFLLGVFEKLGQYWFETAWILGIVATFIQTAFLIRVYRGGVRAMTPPWLPDSLLFLTPLTKWISAHRNAVVFYPLLTGVALFLYWTFDHSTLTLLWVAECFGIFSLSILLREAHFRHVALAGLALCIARLLLYDLAKAPTLTRAAVFAGVGALMIGMHALYNKYRDRFMN
ncbi:MAG: hypothetical protein CVV64_20170 [Candidatus Wallbacteria bacterium HGW-Wallbacteria-1]|jgi:hypothetical protein|uniref:DUF2339 domain-containing protein n=1 Tax=Candidatus Wallbacteria bacterium HGW-Wallbacteria-1 TaxID=2013854 RepID=A0A2N1PIG7_9BACT|nr:MAG: hypothetical protein CVV64_20170 [Candidatus Wallbacteria bacterium HGW-Wallbacteria-1]